MILKSTQSLALGAEGGGGCERVITLFTIHNYLTFAASYIADATREARAVATTAEAMQEEGEICSAVQIPPFCTNCN